MAKPQSETTTPMVFALLLAACGSLTIGDSRLVPFQPAAVPKELADKVDTGVNPVQFFDNEESARKKAGDMKAAEEACKQVLQRKG